MRSAEMLLTTQVCVKKSIVLCILLRLVKIFKMDHFEVKLSQYSSLWALLYIFIE